MLDTHTHSTFSDGFLSPEEIIRLMYGRIRESKEKDAILSITDHDSTAAIDETMRFARKMLGETDKHVYLLPGAETEARKYIHILMYFNPDEQLWKKRSILEIFRKNESARDERNRAILDRLGELDVFLKYDDVFGNTSGAKTRSNIADAIARNGYAADAISASKLYLRHGCPAHVPLESPLEAYELVQIISDAGVLPVIAHPYGIEAASLEELRACGLEGTEVINGNTQFREANNFATQYDILRTVGSDCHFNGNKCFGYSYFPNRKNTCSYHHISPEILQPIEADFREKILGWLT